MSGLLAQLGIVKEAAAALPAVTSGVFAAGVPNTGTLTMTAHGLRVGDVIVVTGATPAGWNGTWVVQAVTANTVVIYIPATVANTSVQPTVTASAYGVAGTPTRFFEFVSDGMKLVAPPIVSTGLRAGNKVDRVDRFVADRQGSNGDFTTEVKTKGFGIWLEQMLGTVATAGPTDSCYTHTGSIGSLQGKSTTLQIGRPLAASSYIAPFTYAGCKVASWELSCRKGDKLMLKLTLDGQDEVLTVALAVASYPSGDELLTFIGGSVTVGGTAWDVVRDITISCDNGLDGDRRFQRTSSFQKEPLEANMRKITATFTAEFQDLTMYNRFAAATAAGRVAAVSCLWRGPTLAGASTYPSLTASMPGFRFDGDTPPVTGPQLLVHNITGQAMNTTGGTQDAISLAYVTTDSVP